MSIRGLAERTVFSVAVLLVLLPPTLVAAAKPPPEEPAAILAVSSGAVTVIRGGEKIPGSFGFALKSGDVIDAGKDAQAAVLFESGQIIELGPGSRITVGGLPAKTGGSLVAEVPDAFSGSLGKFSQPASSEGGLAALPQLRSAGGADEPRPVAPRSTLVQPGSVAFRFTPVEDALEYSLTLVGSGPAAGTHRVPANDEAGLDMIWVPPAGVVFEPGESWTWSVEATTADGPIRSEAVPFEVASQTASLEIDNLSQRLLPLLDASEETRVDAARYLIGSYCRSSGFYGAAIEQLEALSARHPNRKDLHRELGVLYQAVGRNDEAAEAYRKALGD